MTDVISGVKDIGKIIKLIQAAMKDCSGIKADWDKLEKIAKTFSSPKSFIWHVGGDIIHNGVKITTEIKSAIADYQTEKWYDFGFKCGEAASDVFIGTPKEFLQLDEQESAKKEMVAQFFQGFYSAFGYHFNLLDLLECVNQEDEAALLLDLAYQAFGRAIRKFKKKDYPDMVSELVGVGVSVYTAYG